MISNLKMSKSVFKISKFDAHMKLAEGTVQQTICGSFLTVFAVIVIVFLLFSELRLYASNTLVSRMIADKSVSSDLDSVRLYFDIEFPDIECQGLSFEHEVTRGQVQEHPENKPENIRTEELAHPDKEKKWGCRIHGSIVTDKAAGHFLFRVAPIGTINTQEVSKRHDPEHLPGEVAKILHAQPPPTPRLPPLNHRINHVLFLPEARAEGMNKLMPWRPQDGLNRHKYTSGAADFEVAQKELQDMGIDLENEKALYKQSVNVKDSTGIKHYNMQVVPTHYDSKKQKINQYNVNEKEVDMIIAAHGNGLQLGGTPFSKFYGVVFTYDFYPLVLSLEVQKENILEFIANLFGIIGGVITIISLFDGIFHTASKAIIGKKD